jgi:hypothetical protein
MNKHILDCLDMDYLKELKDNNPAIMITPKLNDALDLIGTLKILNEKISPNGYLLINLETYSSIKKKYRYPVNYLIYLSYCLAQKILVKVNKKWMTRKGRLISKSEIFDKLQRCGFKVTDLFWKNNKLYLIAQKIEY